MKNKKFIAMRWISYRESERQGDNGGIREIEEEVYQDSAVVKEPVDDI